MDNRAQVINFDDSPLGYASPLKSSNYNDIINSLRSSVLRCINRSRDIIDKQTQYNRALVAENQFLASRVLELSTYGRDQVQADTALITGFDSAVDSGSNAKFDKLAGQVTVGNQRKWSKVPRFTDSNGKRRPSKDTFITLDGVGMAHSDNIYNILDGRMDTFWLLDTSEGTQHTITIQFPSSIRPHVNSLSLTPFPAFSFQIDEVLVTQADGQIHNVTPVGYAATDLSAINTHFKPTSWGNTVTIRFTARGNIVGISNLDLFLIDYFDSFAEFKYKVDAFSPTNQVSFTHIERVDLMDFGLFEVQDTDGTYDRFKNITVKAFVGSTETTISEATLKNQEPTLLSTPKTVDDDFFISFKFKKHNGQTPVFRSARVKYSN